MTIIQGLECNPLCISTTADYDEETDLIFYGDDGGYVNVLYMHRRFLVDTAGDSHVNTLTASKICRKDSLETNNIYLYRVFESNSEASSQ